MVENGKVHNPVSDEQTHGKVTVTEAQQIILKEQPKTRTLLKVVSSPVGQANANIVESQSFSISPPSKSKSNMARPWNSEMVSASDDREDPDAGGPSSCGKSNHRSATVGSIHERPGYKFVVASASDGREDPDAGNPRLREKSDSASTVDGQGGTNHRVASDTETDGSEEGLEVVGSLHERPGYKLVVASASDGREDPDAGNPRLRKKSDSESTVEVRGGTNDRVTSDTATDGSEAKGNCMVPTSIVDENDSVAHTVLEFWDMNEPGFTLGLEDAIVFDQKDATQTVSCILNDLPNWETSQELEEEYFDAGMISYLDQQEPVHLEHQHIEGGGKS